MPHQKIPSKNIINKVVELVEAKVQEKNKKDVAKEKIKSIIQT